MKPLSLLSISFLLGLVYWCNACRFAGKTNSQLEERASIGKELPKNAATSNITWGTELHLMRQEAHRKKNAIIDSLLIYSDAHRKQIKSLLNDGTETIRFFSELFKKVGKTQKEENKAIDKQGIPRATRYDFGVGWYHRNIRNAQGLWWDKKMYQHNSRLFIKHWGGNVFTANKKPLSTGIQYFIHQYIVNQTDRRPENLRRLFDKYKKILYTFIPKKAYEQASLNQLVQSLLDRYHFLKKNKYYTFFAKLSAQPFALPYSKESTFLNHFYQKKNTVRLSYGLPGKHYSIHFWHRRYLEGNMETVYEILKEIADHYHTK